MDDPGSQHPYNYANSNPVAYSDPLGLHTGDVFHLQHDFVLSRGVQGRVQRGFSHDIGANLESGYAVGSGTSGISLTTLERPLFSGSRREAWIGGSEGQAVGGLLGYSVNGTISGADEVMFRVYTEAGISSKARRDVELSYNAIRGLMQSRQIAGPDPDSWKWALYSNERHQAMADIATNGFFLGFIEALQVSDDPLRSQIKVSIPFARVGGRPDVRLGFVDAPKAAKALRVNRPGFAESPTQPFSMWRTRPPDPSRMFHEWTPWDARNAYSIKHWLEHAHTVLDVAGLASATGTPVGLFVGTVADSLNALLYVGEGNLAGVGISVAGLVPWWGDGVTVGRLATRAFSRATDGLASARAQVGRVASDFGRGWNSGMLRVREYAFIGPGGALIPLADGIEAAVAGARARRIAVGHSGHHIPSVRKSIGRPFEVGRGDKSRPTFFSAGVDPAHDHWRLHDAERAFVGPRQGAFAGTDDELFQAYRDAYKGLDDIRGEVRSPNGDYTLGTNVSPVEAVDLIENWLKSQGLR